jgi:DUF4097 and DUF4098 domain-containing protein YvlB
MTTTRTSLSIGTVAATALAGTIALATPASAHGGDDGVIKRGSCSNAGTWKLKAKHDNGRIEVEFEVDTNRAGKTFAVRLSDNRVAFFRGHRTTQPPSGSFEVERRTANRAGTDVIRGRAVRGDNVCAGKVRL